MFVSIPGHYTWTFDDPLFRVLLLRAMAWCAHEEDVDRLTPLATLGAPGWRRRPDSRHAEVKVSSRVGSGPLSRYLGEG